MSRLRPDQLVVGRSYRVVVPRTGEIRESVTFFGFELGGRRVQVSDGHDNIVAVPTLSLAFYERPAPVIPVLPAQIPPEVVPAAVDGTDPVRSAYNDRSKNSECPVCMERLQPKSATDTVVVIETTQARAAGTVEHPVTCGHKFHRNCLRTLTTCPVCRGPIVRLRPGFPEPMTGGRRRGSSSSRSRSKRSKRSKTRKN